MKLKITSPFKRCQQSQQEAKLVEDGGAVSVNFSESISGYFPNRHSSSTSSCNPAKLCVTSAVVEAVVEQDRRQSLSSPLPSRPSSENGVPISDQKEEITLEASEVVDSLAASVDVTCSQNIDEENSLRRRDDALAEIIDLEVGTVGDAGPSRTVPSPQDDLDAIQPDILNQSVDPDMVTNGPNDPSLNQPDPSQRR